MSETMTPKELMELAAEMDHDLIGHHHVAAALRSYAELVAALEWLVNVTGDLNAQETVAFAKDAGWPGLEEL